MGIGTGTGKGGRRAGAGRKKGEPNKASAEAIAEAAKSGELPRDYMLRVMRDLKASTRRRDAMAIAAAPYFHNRLSSISHTGGDGKGPIEHRHVRDKIEKDVDELLNS